MADDIRVTLSMTEIVAIVGRLHVIDQVAREIGGKEGEAVHEAASSIRDVAMKMVYERSVGYNEVKQAESDNGSSSV